MKLFIKGILLFTFASFTPLAFGQNTTIWSNNGGTTSFETPSNWNNGVPTTGLTAYVVPDGIANPDGLFLVTQGGSTDITILASISHTSDGLFITNDIGDNLTPGTVNMTFATGTTYTVSGFVGVRDGEALIYAGNLTVGDGLFVGDAGNGSMTLTSGILDASTGFITVGQNAGNSGTFVQNGASTVLANQFYLGTYGGTNGGTGTYTISGTQTANFTLSGLDSFAKIGNGTFTQNNVNSTVDFSSSLENSELGVISGDNAVYNLEAGNLITGNIILGSATGATGTINQSGGYLTSADSFEIGSSGTGNFVLSGGSADFQNGFTLGVAAGSTGTLTQSGATTLTSEGVATIGSSGTGTYNLQGGTATFSDGVVVGPMGTINQTGGTLIIPGGQTLDLSTAGAFYTLGGSGILQIGNGSLVGTAGVTSMALAGGTIQITTPGAFTDSLNTTLSGVSTIDAVTTSGITTVTMGGNLSGTGGITFAGGAGTTFQFSGINTYTGPTTIASGTLNANAADISNSSALVIGTTGPPATLNLALGSSSLSYAGAISGNGNLNVNFNAAGETLSLTNRGNSVSTVNITLGANTGPNASLTPGTLQVYNGSFGTISDNGTGSSVIIGDNSGTSRGVVTFGNATYTGTTTINTGFTLNANTLSSSVTNSGSLFALGSGSLASTGTIGLNPNSAVGSTFNVNGTLSSTGANAVIDIRANGAQNVADSIVASGTATIDSASTIHVTGTGNISTPIPIVTGTTGLTIAPGALPNISSTLLFVPTLTRVGNSIDLTTVQVPVSTFALTPNEQAVAVPIDQTIIDEGTLPPGQQAAFNILLQGFNRLTSSAQVASALEELTPESLQYSRMIAFENSNFLVQRMNGIDAQLRAGYGGLDTSAINVISPGFNSGLGRSLGSLLAYNDPAFHSTAPNGVNYYPGGASGTGGTMESGSDEEGPSSASPSSSRSSNPSWNSSSQVISDTPNPYMATQNPSGPETPGFSEFISGDAVLADLNQNQSNANAPSSKASYTAGDATAGVSFRMNSHLAMGVLFDYNHTDAKTDANGSKTHVDSYSPGLYATYFDHGFYVNGLFSFGYNNYSNSRDIAFAGETASSHPSGQQYVGDLDFGYDFHPDKSWTFGPTLGVTYTHLVVDSFTETGAPGADLDVQDQNADSIRSRLGGHVIFQTNTGDVLLQPNFTAMWQHEYLDNGSGITSSFNDFSASPFTIQTASPSRDSALIGVGLTATLNTSLSLYLNYLADVGAGDYWAQSVIAGFKARF